MMTFQVQIAKEDDIIESLDSSKSLKLFLLRMYIDQPTFKGRNSFILLRIKSISNTTLYPRSNLDMKSISHSILHLNIPKNPS